MRTLNHLCLGTLYALTIATLASAGCGSKDGSTFHEGGGPGFIPGNGDASLGDGGLSPFGDGGRLPMCTSMNQCVHSCSGSTSTTITGKVYDPAGKNPLYGVVVYVPSQPIAPISTGASCYTCGDLYTGDPVAFAVTDSSGSFTITGAPDGANVPLVIQIGKWRKQYTVPSVARCGTTAMPDKTLLLPANHNPSDPRGGDIPSIAIATGGADTLECLLRRIGVDASEYGPGASGNGRIHIFVGDGGSNTSPAAPAAYASMWDSKADLMRYDIVLLTCEGHETTSDGNKAPLTTTMQQALYDYAQSGGRAFASHYHYAWFDTGPFSAQNLATWATGSQSYGGNGDINGVVETTLPDGSAFPRGEAMKEWLGNVGALTGGELPIQVARHNADVTAANTASVPWILADQNASPPNKTEYFSFDTPFGAMEGGQCGRVVYSDLHVGAASKDYNWDGMNVPSNAIVPTGCADADLSPQEKALEFMLFDLSACITPPSQGAGGIPPR